MPELPESWTARHFSLANPKGPARGDVAEFFRHLANTLETYGTVEVQDVVFHMEVDEHGDQFPTATVYFHEEPASD